jgi:hypothetical protein
LVTKAILASVTVIIIFDVVAAVVGEPEITPAALRFNPAGRFCCVHVMVPVPPVDANVSGYEVLAVAAGKGDVVVIDSAGLTAKLKVLVAVAPTESVTITTMPVVLVAVEITVVGVPVMLAPLMANPSGKAVEPEATENV